jgi:hypothetical protein
MASSFLPHALGNTGHTGTASDQVILMVLGSGLFDGRITISTTRTKKQK